MLMIEPPASPIIVRVVQPESNSALDFADVLIRSLGLTVVLTLGAAFLGLALGLALIGLRMWRGRREEGDGAYGLRVTPHS